ncbi:MAG: NAD(P)-binding protein [Nitriliruptorales bacterium]|nr:NAD(P)-binding protein [Nitriliruptorales bacterium]
MRAELLRAAVVGAGIGGLATGLALYRRGIDVTVYEQAPALGEVGAGVQLTPNSFRLLDRFGLGEDLRQLGVKLDQRRSRYYRMDGTPIAPVLTTDSKGNALYGIHRADLVSVLAANLPSDVVRTSHRCTGFSQSDSAARLEFENGTVTEADVVIAADGIHSSLQRHVVEPAEPVNSGSVAYRGLLAADANPSWPTDRFELWMGAGKHFLVFPVRAGTLINFVGFVPSEVHAEESWSALGDPAVLTASFAGWDSRIEKLLATVRNTFWWGLYDREPLWRWTHGRLTLLGDAAHPMLPHLGQGANQSIEDAVALSIVLTDATPETAPVRLLEYEALRHPRTTDVQAGSRANGLRYDSRYEDLIVRDVELDAVKAFRLSLYDYDVEQAAIDALSRRQDIGL